MQTLQKKTRASRRKYKMEGRGRKTKHVERKFCTSLRCFLLEGAEREREGGYVEIVGVRVREGEIDI